jgi:acyl-CoA thioesterase-1
MKRLLIWIGVFMGFGVSMTAAPKTILFFGDSLTAGYGLSESQAYPALIQAKLNQDHLDWKVINAGVSGDTTQTGLNRLAWALRSKPDWVVVALGANDGLRGLPVAQMRHNLIEIIRQAQKSGAKVAFMGIRIPINYGVRYETQFIAAIDAVAHETNVPYLPFFIQDVAAKKEFNQADGVHPNAAGQKRVAARVYGFIKPLVTK